MTSGQSVARSERQQLCDVALSVGEDAPTLCGEWDVKELVVHLLVRERSPVAAPGILLKPFEPLTNLVSDRVARTDFATLVERLRNPRFTPLALPVVDQAVNTIEFFVHHEDIRRAQPDWQPRTLDDRVQDALWTAIKLNGRGLIRAAGVPVKIRRSDTDATATLRRGSDPAVLSGLPSEIVLFVYGRQQTSGLSFEGPDAAVSALKNANLGL